MGKTDQFNPRIFWDGVLSNVNCPLFFKFLNVKNAFTNSVYDLSSSGNFVKGKGEWLSRLKWVLAKNREGHGHPGRDLSDNVYDAKKTCSLFSSIQTLAYTAKKKVEPEDLEKNGLNEQKYLRTLRQISEFMAWGYNQQVPEEIQQLYSTVENLALAIPEEELARLSMEDLSNNTTARFPVLFIIDNNICMGEDDSLLKLEQGLNDLFEEIRSNRSLSWAVELCIYTCGGKPKQIVNFGTIDRQETLLDQMEILPFGVCKMGEAIIQSLDKLEERLLQMSDSEVAVDWYRPWLIILSNGKFVGDMTGAINCLNEMKKKRELQVYVRAINSKANMEQLSLLSEDTEMLTSVNGFFADVFKSLQMSSYSIPGGERVHLENEKGFSDNR